MPNSAILGIPQVASNQSQKEATINGAVDLLEKALCDTADFDLTAGNITVSDAAYRALMRLHLINATASGRSVTLGASAIKRMALIRSASANTQIIAIKRGTTTVNIKPGTTMLVYTDGTANGLRGDVVGAGDMRLVFGTPGVLPVAGQVVAEIAMLANDQLATFDVSQWILKAAVAPTADWTLTIKKNGATIGTGTITAGAVSGTWSFTTSISFVDGDICSFVAPATQDATMSGLRALVIARRGS